MKTTARIKPVSTEVRVARLRNRHQDVKERIADELKRPAPCSMVLQQLKRRRLIIKDQIQRYDGLLRTLAAGSGPRHLA